MLRFATGFMEIQVFVKRFNLSETKNFCEVSEVSEDQGLKV